MGQKTTPTRDNDYAIICSHDTTLKELQYLDRLPCCSNGFRPFLSEDLLRKDMERLFSPEVRRAKLHLVDLVGTSIFRTLGSGGWPMLGPGRVSVRHGLTNGHGVTTAYWIFSPRRQWRTFRGQNSGTNGPSTFQSFPVTTETLPQLAKTAKIG